MEPPEFLQDLISTLLEPNRKDVQELVKKECVPISINANKEGQIDFTFNRGINFKMDEELLAKIKNAGSIQMQVIKADGAKYS